MFTVIATNHLNSCRIERTYLERQLAISIFEVATHCEDCTNVDLIDSITGEVLLTWEAFKGITWIA